MIHISLSRKHIHKVKFYPSADDFTQALLVMLVTNIMSAPPLYLLASLWCMILPGEIKVACGQLSNCYATLSSDKTTLFTKWGYSLNLREGERQNKCNWYNQISSLLHIKKHLKKSHLGLHSCCSCGMICLGIYSY